MEQYDNDTIKQLDSWFLEQKEKGFTLDQIKQAMIDNGYDSEFSNEYIAKKAVLYQEPVSIPDNQTQTSDNPSQATETNNTEPTSNTWQTNRNETNSYNLNEAQKQEKFKNYSYIDKVKLIITKPKQFFDEMPREIKSNEVVIFAAINYFLFGILQLIINSLTNISQMLNPSMYLGIGALMISAITMIYIVTAYDYIFFKIFKGKGTYKSMIFVFLYSTAIIPLIAIPLVGIIAGLYMLYISLIGLSKVHDISMAKTIGVLFVAITVIIIILGLIAYIALNAILNLMGASDITSMITQMM